LPVKYVTLRYLSRTPEYKPIGTPYFRICKELMLMKAKQTMAQWRFRSNGMVQRSSFQRIAIQSNIQFAV